MSEMVKKLVIVFMEDCGFLFVQDEGLDLPKEFYFYM